MDRRSDAALIEASIRGDVDAFCLLTRRHRDTYARYAARMLGSVEDADDVLQSAFMRAYRGLAECRNPQRFSAWMYRIVINECRTFAKRRARREQRFVRDDVVLGSIESPHPSDAQAVDEEIQHAIARLDAAQREAFLLKHVEDLSYEEMSELTGAGVSALKMRVKRACERLREMLEGVYHD